ncbi:hypothetical protein SDC9_204881 [bioreactor metagenome]|uniref:Uncharacterized protein n=1 Tax=bioreactor metagenome TaxID=1076179 RepID=A0A645J1A6_9ZZZZ
MSYASITVLRQMPSPLASARVEGNASPAGNCPVKILVFSVAKICLARLTSLPGCNTMPHIVSTLLSGYWYTKIRPKLVLYIGALLHYNYNQLRANYNKGACQHG